MPGKGTIEQGRMAEDAALRFLQAQGLRLETRNYRCRAGELDLVMRDRRHWVFVEVRYRKNHSFGAPQATVGRAKQRRLVLAAAHFLLQHEDRPSRFDVVALTGSPPRIEWIRNAFDASGP